jgi:hypothetical protein
MFVILDKVFVFLYFVRNVFNLKKPTRYQNSSDYTN